MKKLFSSLSWGVIMLFAVGVMGIFMTARSFAISFLPAVSFEDLLDGELVKEGSHVAGNVVFSMDSFASESTYTRYKDGSRSGDRKSGNYYTIPTADGYIALKSMQKEVSSLNDLVDETFTYIDGGAEPATKIFIEGEVHSLEPKLTNYLREYLVEMGYTDKEIDDMGEFLVIRSVPFKSVRIMFFVSLVSLLLAAGILWRRCNRPPLPVGRVAEWD